MSRRAIRRLETAQKSTTPAAEPADEDEEEEEPMRRSAANPFDALEEVPENNDDDELDEEVISRAADPLPVETGHSESHTDRKTHAEKSAKPVNGEDGTRPPPKSEPTKSKKKRKKPRSKKPRSVKEQAPQHAAPADEPWTDEDGPTFQDALARLIHEIEELAGVSSTVDEAEVEVHSQRSAEAEIDATRSAETEVHTNGPAKTGEVSDPLGYSHLMKVDTRKLQSANELRRLFGADTARSEMTAGAGRRGRRQPHGLSPALRRKLYLVNPRETWAPVAPGLSMSYDQERQNGDASWFKYEFSGDYGRVQAMYMVAVETHDPNNLVHLLNSHPYHVDSLIQLAEVCRQTGELEQASELISRALCLLERAWHMSFKPFDGSCRISFADSVNRSLFVALFRHAQLMSRRGLYRTAFEVTKLLYNLEPGRDPSGALLLIDSFALLAGENEWVIEAHKSFRDVPLHLLPNFAYSAALAAKVLRRDDATDLLRKALSTFPMTVEPLLRSLNDGSHIGSLNEIYSREYEQEDAALTRVATVYAERSKALWAGEHADWLRETATAVAGAEIPQEYELVRSEAAQMLKERGLYKHVHVSDFFDSGSSLSPQMAEQVVGAQPRPRLSAPQTLMHFLRTILPWNGAEEITAIANRAGEEDGALEQVHPDLWAAIDAAINQAFEGGGAADIGSDEEGVGPPHEGQ